MPQHQVKRRTMQAPKHGAAASVLGSKTALRRGQSVSGPLGAGSAAGAGKAGVEGGLYKGELSKLEVESGYGMGMALPSSTRHSAQVRIHCLRPCGLVSSAGQCLSCNPSFSCTEWER
jgi:hypothetical protein